MKLFEIATNVTDNGTHKSHEFDPERSAIDHPFGIKEQNIHMTREEEQFFKKRNEKLLQLKRDLDAQKQFDAAAAIKPGTQVPPDKIDVIHAYTLVKNPKSLEELDRVFGFLGAVKGRSSSHVMTVDEIDKFIEHSVDTIISKISTPGKLKYKELLTGVYTKYLKPFKTPSATSVPDDVIIVPLSSTAGLVGRFADEVSKQVGARIVQGAFLKDSWPSVSSFIGTSGYEIDGQQFDYTLRLQSEFYTDMVNNLDSELFSAKAKTAIAAVKKVLDAQAKDEENASLKEKLTEAVTKLRQIVTYDFVTYTADLNKELVVLRQSKKSPNYKSSAEYNKSMKKIIELRTKRDALPRVDRSFGTSVKSEDDKTNATKQKLLQFIRDYHKLQDQVIKAETLFMNNTNPELEDDLSQRHLELERQLNSKTTRYNDCVDKLFNAIMFPSFKVHDAVPKSGPDRQKAFSGYQKVHDVYGRELDGKRVIFVDDNIDSGASISDAIKSLYAVNIIPKSMVMFTPHLLKSDPKAGKASQEASDIKRRHRNEERAVKRASDEAKRASPDMPEKRQSFIDKLKSNPKHLPGQGLEKKI